MFRCGNFTLIFTVIFNFLDRIFFLNGFPNPFIVHSRPRFFLLNQISFSRSWFSVYMRDFGLDFLFLISFLSDVLEMVHFPYSFIVRSRFSFLFSQ